MKDLQVDHKLNPNMQLHKSSRCTTVMGSGGNFWGDITLLFTVQSNRFKINHEIPRFSVLDNM